MSTTRSAKPAKERGRAFECTACGQVAAKWVGRCPGCGGWGTVEEGLPPAATVGAPGGAPRASSRPASPVRPMEYK